MKTPDPIARAIKAWNASADAIRATINAKWQVENVERLKNYYRQCQIDPWFFDPSMNGPVYPPEANCYYDIYANGEPPATAQVGGVLNDSLGCSARQIMVGGRTKNAIESLLGSGGYGKQGGVTLAVVNTTQQTERATLEELGFIHLATYTNTVHSTTCYLYGWFNKAPSVLGPAENQVPPGAIARVVDKRGVVAVVAEKVKDLLNGKAA